MITVASGNNFEVSAAIASSSMSFAPEVATITGSSTTLAAWWNVRRSAITLMSSALETMPIFTATGGMSENTASICAASISGGVLVTIVTPVVFCAVSAAMAVMPNTPLASMVFRSAWMPAPPEESDPAILSTGANVVVIANSFLRFVRG